MTKNLVPGVDCSMVRGRLVPLGRGAAARAVVERFEPDAGVTEQCEAFFSEVDTAAFPAVQPHLARLAQLPAAGPGAGSSDPPGGAHT